MSEIVALPPSGQTVLIVDDTPANLGIVMDALSERGLRVLIALDGEEGFDRAVYSQPELILLDVNMPGTGGIETCRRLKADPRTSDIPVVFMTVADGIDAMVEGFQAGGVDYVTKPVRLDELVARVNAQLSMRALHKGLAERNRQLQEEILVRQRAESELSRIRDELEVHVARRTEQLARANADLQAQIAERARTEATLRASEASLANAQRLAGIGDWQWQASEGVTHVSAEVNTILGARIRPSADCYAVYLASVHPDDRATVRRVCRTVLVRGVAQAVDHRIVGADGSERIVQLRVESLGEGVRAALVGTIQDVTARKRIEHQLFESREQSRQLSAYMEAIREDERKRMALEIHDELGQLLTALKMDVSLLKMKLTGGQKRQDAQPLLNKVGEMRELVEQTIRMVRNVANHLRPAALNFGLVSALEWLAEDFNKRTGIQCQFYLNAREPVLCDAHATAVFRMVQESLTNVARHANASRVHVALTYGRSGLELNVSDNGCGFEPTLTGQRDSYGLLGMSERARLIGAALQIDSAPGAGTVISISIPINTGSEDDQNLDRG
jgi:signal transduction histidine kinase